MAAMMTIMDIGTEKKKKKSNSESLRRPDGSHQVSAQFHLPFRSRCGLNTFKIAAILDIGNEQS